MIYENYHVSRHLGRKLEKNEKGVTTIGNIMREKE